MIPGRSGWTFSSSHSAAYTGPTASLAEISSREARYTLRENELLAEMFALAEGGILEEVHRSLCLEEDEEWAWGLLRYIVEHL